MRTLEVKRIVLLGSCLLVLGGCGNDKKSEKEPISQNNINPQTQATIIQGHTLPPEPDPAINNSTLLGVDVNKNGVRDDVERYIYERFGSDPEYPKTKIALAMQYAKANQFIIGNNPQKAFENESYKKMDAALDCKWYWYDEVTKTFNLSSVEGSIAETEFRLKNKIYDNEFREKIYNTKMRMKTYFYYNASMSEHILSGGGGVLSATPDKCTFDMDSLGEIK